MRLRRAPLLVRREGTPLRAGTPHRVATRPKVATMYVTFANELMSSLLRLNKPTVVSQAVTTPVPSSNSLYELIR